MTKSYEFYSDQGGTMILRTDGKRWWGRLPDETRFYAIPSARINADQSVRGELGQITIGAYLDSGSTLRQREDREGEMAVTT